MPTRRPQALRGLRLVLCLTHQRQNATRTSRSIFQDLGFLRRHQRQNAGRSLASIFQAPGCWPFLPAEKPETHCPARRLPRPRIALRQCVRRAWQPRCIARQFPAPRRPLPVQRLKPLGMTACPTVYSAVALDQLRRSVTARRPRAEHASAWRFSSLRLEGFSNRHPAGR